MFQLKVFPRIIKTVLRPRPSTTVYLLTMGRFDELPGPVLYLPLHLVVVVCVQKILSATYFRGALIWRLHRR